MPLLVFGWKGYEKTIVRQIELGQMLKEKLIQNNWMIYNETDLPVLCFSDEGFADDPNFAKTIVSKVVNSGEAWISIYPIGNKFTIRACITNYSTSENELDKLIESINIARSSKNFVA